MQGQITVESILKDSNLNGSTSSSSVTAHLYVGNMLSNQNIADADYFLSPDELNMPFVNSANLDPVGVSSWNFSDPRSSGREAENQNGAIETKMEYQCTPSNESRTTSNGMPFVGNTDLSFGGSMSTLELVPSSNLDVNTLENLNNAFQIPYHNAGFVGNSSPDLGVSVHCDARAFGADAGIVPSSNGSAISSGIVTCENGTGNCDGMQSGLLDGRCLSCKRKNIDASGGGLDGPSFFEQRGSRSVESLYTRVDVSRSCENHYIVNPAGFLNRQVGSGMSTAGSSRLAGVTGSSHRNVRMRMTPAEHLDILIPNLQTVSNPQGPQYMLHQPPPLYNPFYQMGMAVPSTNSFQTHPPVIPGVMWPTHSLPWNARPSISPAFSSVVGEEHIFPREESNPSRCTMSNGISRPVIFVPGNVMHVAQEPVNWSIDGNNGSLQGNMASSQGSGSSMAPLIASNLLPHQNPSNWSQHSLELARRSIALDISNSIFQGSGIQSHEVQASQQTIAPNRNRSVRVRDQSQQLLRLANLLERQSDAYTSDAISHRMANIRERRRRLLSEVRNVLGLLRRGEDPRFEDLIFEQALFLGAVDLHDRHRDMRLDVDNMSYEELLALEERMGNVSTGLNEESLSKCLKQWIYWPPLGATSPDADPCCICQEEYYDGEDMGTLDCGHEFHAACVKQWLRQKNLCPICKKAALVA